LLPLYLKQYYKDEPLFKESKVVTSVYSQSFDNNLNGDLIDKIKFDEIEEAHVENLKTPNYSNLMKVAVDFSDGIIKGSQELPDELEHYLAKCKKPVLDYQYPEAFAEAYTDFYTTKILK
jgi:starch synthase